MVKIMTPGEDWLTSKRSHLWLQLILALTVRRTKWIYFCTGFFNHTRWFMWLTKPVQRFSFFGIFKQNCSCLAFVHKLNPGALKGVFQKDKEECKRCNSRRRRHFWSIDKRGAYFRASQLTMIWFDKASMVAYQPCTLYVEFWDIAYQTLFLCRVPPVKLGKRA